VPDEMTTGIADGNAAAAIAALHLAYVAAGRVERERGPVGANGHCPGTRVLRARRLVPRRHGPAYRPARCRHPRGPLQHRGLTEQLVPAAAFITQMAGFQAARLSARVAYPGWGACPPANAGREPSGSSSPHSAVGAWRRATGRDGARPGHLGRQPLQDVQLLLERQGRRQADRLQIVPVVRVAGEDLVGHLLRAADQRRPLGDGVADVAVRRVVAGHVPRATSPSYTGPYWSRACCVVPAMNRPPEPDPR
jgi:hypothetical protein